MTEGKEDDRVLPDEATTIDEQQESQQRRREESELIMSQRTNTTAFGEKAPKDARIANERIVSWPRDERVDEEKSSLARRPNQFNPSRLSDWATQKALSFKSIRRSFLSIEDKSKSNGCWSFQFKSDLKIR